MVALFFAVESRIKKKKQIDKIINSYNRNLPHSKKHNFKYSPSNIDSIANGDCCIYALNAYNLNRNNGLLHRRPGLFLPRSFDVTFRSSMTDHVYMDSVIAQMGETQNTYQDSISNIAVSILGKYEISKDIKSHDDGHLNLFDELNSLSQNKFQENIRKPVAVMPKLENQRMFQQRACFTIHGGKCIFSRDMHQPDSRFEYLNEKVYGKKLEFIEPPIHLNEDNDANWREILMDEKFHLKFSGQVQESKKRPYMLKIVIRAKDCERIIQELDSLGINESAIYMDFDNHADYAERKWKINNISKSNKSKSIYDRLMSYYPNLEEKIKDLPS